LRFQTSETVSIQDPEIVLRVLEMCLRDISKEVVRSGDQITLRGLGPSPRAVNYNDKTILSVSAEDDKTIISADVSFQASAFLGEASQDVVVRSKLEQVFEQMKSQIDIEKRREAPLSAIPNQAVTSSSSQPVVETPSTPLSLIPAASMIPTPVAGSSAVALLETTEAPAEFFQDAGPLPMSQEAEEHLDEDETLAASPTPPIPQEELQILHVREIPLEESETKQPKLVVAIAAVIVFVLLATGAFLPRSRNRIVGWYSAATRSRQSVAATTVHAPTSSASSGGPVPGTNVVAAAPHPDSSALPAPNIEDPKVWLEKWAAAMRSRDPVAQASFYANPVDRYIDQKNVSNTVLVGEKRADIERRLGLWTVKLNDVVVESRTPSEATVLLEKHFIVEAEPSQVSELFVKTRLHLKLVNGQWKIASEREIRAATPASIDPIDR
jgi:hypothetical protein